MRVRSSREWTIVEIDTMAATSESMRANAALDDLYRRHVGDVYRYTYAVLGNHADAEDVTQTTFVNALRALERGEQPRNASSWLVAIAHNLVRQRWRQAAARPTEIELVGDVAAATHEEELELDELVTALQKIPPAQREALVMRELEGRSYQEISELLGVTNSALETLLFRARRSLADELENLVTCQTAELAMSQRLDGRLSRKERRRLKEHLHECASCARLAEMQGKQRRAFKGLALLPLPVGLTLFKGVPSASAAAGLSSIGGAATGASGSGAVGVGSATTTTVGLTGVGTTGATATAGAAVGGSVVGGALAKVAAVVVAATVATGAGYQGLDAIRADAPGPSKNQVERPRRGSSTSATLRAAARRSSPATVSPAPAEAPTPTRSAPLEPTQSGDAGPSVLPDASQPASTSSQPRTGPDNQTPGKQSTGREPSPKKPPASAPPVADTTPPTKIDKAPEVDPAQTGETGASQSTGSSETTTGCPGGGAGPGDGAGCGLGYDKREVSESGGGSQTDPSGTANGQPVTVETGDAPQGKPAKP